MKSTAVKRMRSELQETPRPECTAASQVAGSRDRNTVFTIGGILRHTLRASVTVLQESGEAAGSVFDPRSNAASTSRGSATFGASGFRRTPS